MENFNKLTPAQTERLALLSEEMAEAQLVIGKILRHGYENYHPDFPEITNREDLEKEVGHVLLAIQMMTQKGDIDEQNIDHDRKAKMLSIGKWLHHQG